MTALIVLAAGLSRRFGTDDKLLASLNGKSLAQHVIDTLAPFEFSARYVVTGPDTHQRAALFKGYRIVINDAPEDGQWGSIRLGAKAALSHGADRALITLSDMPLVPSAHYRDVLKCKRSAMTSVGGVPQPPALFTANDLPALATLEPGQNGKDVFAKPPEMIALDAYYAGDVDTRDDLARLSQG
ncbi:nucleotidyltransferase family protein [Robiginitomaculum antarcticum]|uniref:nucleotidyltransferase family protein n=1 Tax=Robiginitomaculum antarcticum TaxID=437507 RepID=UPI000360C168|nr:nucleotidyltransferase family protein [Robiginitomaculum antarcticum]